MLLLDCEAVGFSFQLDDDDDDNNNDKDADDGWVAISTLGCAKRAFLAARFTVVDWGILPWFGSSCVLLRWWWWWSVVSVLAAAALAVFLWRGVWASGSSRSVWIG